jgi:tetratricopeptide (TPR) repeat protein
MKFVDRIAELRNAEEFVTRRGAHSDRMLIFNAPPASGFTAFCKHLRTNQETRAIAVYVNGADHIEGNIFLQFLLRLRDHYPERFKQLEATLKSGEQSRWRRIVAAALAGIPYIGSLVKELVGSENSRGQFTQYPSAAAEVICAFVSTASQESQFLIVIDNAQELDESSVDLLRAIVSPAYSNVCFVVGVVHRPNCGRPMSAGRLRSIGYNTHETDFPKPNVELAQALAEESNVLLSDSRAGELVQECDSNIYSLIGAIQKGIHLDEDKLAENSLILKRRIAAYLFASRQSLRESDLLQICSKEFGAIPGFEDSFRTTIRHLSNSGEIESSNLTDADCLISYVPTTTPDMTELQNSPSKRLFYESRLYNYFSSIETNSVRHSAAEIQPLLFRLSKSVEPDESAGRAGKLLRISLGMGSFASARQYLDSVFDSSQLDGRFEDVCTNLAAFVATKRYQDALALVEKAMANFPNERTLKILKAVLRSRLFDFDGCLPELDALLNSSVDVDEKAFLASYLITALVDIGEIRTAQTKFREFRKSCSESVNFGYLLCAGAATYRPSGGKKICREAKQFFQTQEDSFGLASAICNQGVFQLGMGQLDQARKSFDLALSEFERFGLQHVHLALNNMGFLELLELNLDRSNELFERAQHLSQTSTIRINLSLNLAILAAMKNDPDKSQEILNGLKDVVKDYPLQRIQQRFYFNSSLIFSCWDALHEQSLESLDRASSFQDDWNPNFFRAQLTELRAQLAAGNSTLPSELPKKCIPPINQYWYQNPMQILSSKILSPETLI